MKPEESTNIDAVGWTGDQNNRAASTARMLIVLFYALIGPLIGAFWLLAGEAVRTGEAFHIGGAALAVVMSALVLIPYSVAIIPAAFTGIVVTHFAASSAMSFAAALLSPVLFYALVDPTGGFAGAKLAFGNFPLLALLGASIAASLTCWLLTLPLQRRT